MIVSVSNDIVIGLNANLDIDVIVVIIGEFLYNTEIMFTFYLNMIYFLYVNIRGNMMLFVSCSFVNGIVKCFIEK